MASHDLSWIEISSSALRHNVRDIRKQLGSTKLFLVVKSNAYGHGVKEVVRILRGEPGIAGYMTASLDEALALCRYTPKKIIVLSMWQQDVKAVKEAVRHRVTLPVYEWSQAQFLNMIGTSLGRRVLANIKIDVGTARLGFRADAAIPMIKKIAALPFIKIEGVFSHFAHSEAANTAFTNEQTNRFSTALQTLKSAGIDTRLNHIACSAAGLRASAYRFDAARIGIALYGLWPSIEIKKKLQRRVQLQPVLSWKTKVIHMKRVMKGESIGYGLTYRMKHNATIAVLPIGYGDGYDRKLSSTGSVLIRGQRAPVRGRVCMNVSMVQTPSSVRVGDEVVLIGRQKKARITAEEVAALVGTINYEIVTRINPLLPRRITA